MRDLVVGDCPAVHAFASLPEACRYQAWGPNTEEQTRDFVQGAVDARLASPQTRFVYAACLDGELVGIGELKVRSGAHRQGEISYLVHPRVWGRGVGTAVGGELLGRGFGLIGLHRIYATLRSSQRRIGPGAGQARHDPRGPTPAHRADPGRLA
ncbi:GNAT family N-acetyltransferase [Streptomyces sp. NPDC048350]|uniref:GNAT family N-acetyltransferase n=1 Tax=Streptomyces sp. NPDC048350 TaxID=3365538 RepID=UPI003721F9D4